MKQTRPLEPVLPIVGVIARQPFPPLLDGRLEPILGTPLLRSPVWDFTATRYYEEELGTDLKRFFLVFAPREPGQLPEWKTATGRIEQDLGDPRGRRINLDPGYIAMGGLFLASTKPGPHRIYLARGIYGEITLYHHRGAWRDLPWTFPDFRTPIYRGFLTECRELLRRRRSGPSRAR
jgi:hypothetical protein